MFVFYVCISITRHLNAIKLQCNAKRNKHLNKIFKCPFIGV